jgi:Protein of unknown function (DUF1345)
MQTDKRNSPSKRWFAARQFYLGPRIALFLYHFLYTIQLQTLYSLTLYKLGNIQEINQDYGTGYVLTGERILLLALVVCWAVGWLKTVRVIFYFFAYYYLLALFIAVYGLIISLFFQKDSNEALLILASAVALWLMNVLLFSLWYWLLDGRDPHRHIETAPRRADFQFPQQSSDLPGWENWLPKYLDYVFVAFSHSTAFSATDTPVLRHRMKILVMLQSAFSLLIIAVIVARVVGNLPTFNAPQSN